MIENINLAQIEIMSGAYVEIIITDTEKLGSFIKYQQYGVNNILIELSANKLSSSQSDIDLFASSLAKILKEYKFVKIQTELKDDYFVQIMEAVYLFLSSNEVLKKDDNDNKYFLEIDSRFQILLDQAQKNAYSYHLSDILNQLPHNYVNPDTLVAFISKLFENNHDVNVSIMRKNELLENNIGAGLLSVSQGSLMEPAYIKLEYNKSSIRKIGLVGKGVTFDMGGYSIKQGLDLSDMKMDMQGANAVIGAFYRLVVNQENVNVTAYLMICDNLINEKAMIPGDIITYPNGMTVEVKNTDAEGRLILADGLLLAEKDKCDIIVDIATLTGSIESTFGHEYSGLYSSNDQIIKTFELLNSVTNEKVWRMPFIDKYEETLKSHIADFANISTLSNSGSITAALFLRKFVETKNWVHLDIAGVTQKSMYNNYGNGYGVRLLSEFIKKNF